MTYEMGTDTIMCVRINKGYENNGIKYPTKLREG
jgi:hypothetical protein